MKDEIGFQLICFNSKKITHGNFQFYTVVSELFYKNCYISKVISYVKTIL